MKIETSVVINRPVEEVFVYSTEPENTPEWQTGLLESRVTSAGPIGVGSTIRDVRVFMGRQTVSMVQVVVYEPNKEFTLRVESGEIRFKARHLYESTDDGTKVTFIAEGRPNGFFKHAARLIARKMQQQFESDFLKLKYVLEDVKESTVRSSPPLAASVQEYVYDMLNPFWLQPGKVLRGLNSLRMGTGTYVSREGRLKIRELGIQGGRFRNLPLHLGTAPWPVQLRWAYYICLAKCWLSCKERMRHTPYAWHICSLHSQNAGTPQNTLRDDRVNEVRLKIRELGESFAFAARREMQAGIRHPKSGCLKRMLVKKSGSGRAGDSEKLTGRRIAVLVMSRIVDTDAHGGGT